MNMASRDLKKILKIILKINLPHNQLITLWVGMLVSIAVMSFIGFFRAMGKDVRNSIHVITNTEESIETSLPDLIIL